MGRKNSPKIISRKYKNHELTNFDVGKNVSFVPEFGLCCSCGTCEGVCPENSISMTMNKSKGIYEPIVNHENCSECEVCVDICPGFELELDRYISSESIKYLNKSQHFGYYYSINRMYSTDSFLRSNGASGGMATATLKYLLDTGKAEAAIVTQMSEKNPLEPISYIACSSKDLSSSQKSKYLPTPMNIILKSVLNGEIKQKNIAYIGLPCHIESLSLAQEVYPVLRERIKYKFSIFCSRTPTINATHFLLDSCKANAKDLRKINYRGGKGHPGELSFELTSGEIITVPHLHWKYWGYAFLQFFYPSRCFMCYDKTGEQADISFGDNWLAMGENKSGASSVITRNKKSDILIQEMVDCGSAVITQAMTEKEFTQDQDLIKKRSLGNRLFLMRIFKRKIPIYYEQFPIIKKELMRTFKLFRHVLMTEKKAPHWLIYPYIWVSYQKKKLWKDIKSFPYKTTNKVKIRLRQISGLIAMFRISPDRNVNESGRGKIMIVGGFGWKDIGDEAMPHADIINFRNSLSSVDIVMLSRDPQYTTEYHGERSIYDITGISFSRNASKKIRLKVLLQIILFLTAAILKRFKIHIRLWENAREVLNEMATADVLFNVGGGNLNSIMPEELYKKCTTYLAARILKVPVIISGQTIGPFTYSLDKRYARICLNQVNMITLRDKDTSLKRLREIGVNKPLMIDTADDAITLPSLNREDVGRYFNDCLSSKWREIPAVHIIVMNLKGSLKKFKGSLTESSLDNEILMMAQIADALISKHKAKIFFLPTEYSDGVDDRVEHRKILSIMKHQRFAECIEKEYDDIKLKGLISLADLAIGARYHFNVFAASEFVPFLGIATGVYQKTKLEGLANLCGLPKCFYSDDLETGMFKEIWHHIESIFENLSEIKKQLYSRIPTLKERSLLSIKATEKFLQ